MPTLFPLSGRSQFSWFFQPKALAPLPSPDSPPSTPGRWPSRPRPCSPVWSPLRSPALGPRLYDRPHPPRSGRRSARELTGAGGPGRVSGRARIAVLAHAERGGVFQGPAVFGARRAEGPPRGHLVKPWGTGCEEEPCEKEGAPPQLLSPPLSCQPAGRGVTSSNCGGEWGGGMFQLLQHCPMGWQLITEQPLQPKL